MTAVEAFIEKLILTCAHKCSHFIAQHKSVDTKPACWSSTSCNPKNETDNVVGCQVIFRVIRMTHCHGIAVQKMEFSEVVARHHVVDHSLQGLFRFWFHDGDSIAMTHSCLPFSFCQSSRNKFSPILQLGEIGFTDPHNECASHRPTAVKPFDHVAHTKPTPVYNALACH